MTHMILSLILTATLVMTAGVWFYLGLPEVIGLGAAFSGFCKSIFIMCLAYTHLLKLVIVWSGGALFVSGLFYGLFKGLREIIKTRGALKSLPIKDTGAALLLIDDKDLKTAFTCGLFRPRIYVSKGLMSELEYAELKAVLLHELAHKKDRDPLRFFLLSLAKDVFFYLPALRGLLSRIRRLREFEADAKAASAMEEPYSLAHALLKAIRPATPARIPSASHLYETDRKTEVSERVKSLLSGARAPLPAFSLKDSAMSLMMAAFLVFSMTFPYASLKPECTLKHCERHANQLGNDCKRHCESSVGKPAAGHHRHHRA